MEWEHFFDEEYYRMWAVRPKHSLFPEKVFHVDSLDEAIGLADLLNTYLEQMCGGCNSDG